MADLDDQVMLSPRLTFSFEHGEQQETAFLKAYNSKRLHHAWLLTGPQGIGKATFAFRCARYLMANSHSEKYGLLGVSPEDTECRLITAQTHPDLLVLERETGEGGKLKKNITVDAIREISQFFSLAPSRSKYRVCIIDSVDDLNISSSNALLKILEEPPKNGIIFLVSHSSGKLLSTIKSRCRRLAFVPWHEEQLQDFILKHIELNEEKLFRLVHLSKGAPGKALSLYQENALELDDIASNLLQQRALPQQDILKFSAMFRVNNSKINGAKKFSLFLFCLMDQLHNLSLNQQSLREGVVLSHLWQRLANISSQHETINLDRGDIFINIYNEII